MYFKGELGMAQVRQIANMLELFEYFARVQRPAGLAELSAHFGWPRSSTFNIIDTLVETGFLYEPRARNGYYPTPRWLALSEQISSAEPLSEQAIHLVRQIAGKTRETVWIATTSGQYAVMLHVITSPHPIRYAAEPGKRLPLHATATGQALLSQMPSTQQKNLLKRARFIKYGVGSPMSMEEVLIQLQEGKARGWFQSASNYSPDLGGVSMPISLAGRTFAITAAGPLFRVAEKFSEIASLMHATLAPLHTELNKAEV